MFPRMAILLPPAPRRELFDDEHEDYRASFRQFVEREVIPDFPEWEKAQLVPRELFTKAAAHGFLAMEVPEEHGGSGVADWRFNVVLSEEAADSAARLSASRVWIIDPLDGTREFSERPRSDWAVHVALWQRSSPTSGELVEGAVALPAEQITFGTDAPPAVQSADPDQELEKKLRRNPDDHDAKVDVGSDESMDASDPPSSSQPGRADEPVPSSGFPA